MNGSACEHFRGEKAESSDRLDISETAVLIKKRKSAYRSGVNLHSGAKPRRCFNLAVFQGGIADLGSFSRESKTLAMGSRKSEI